MKYTKEELISMIKENKVEIFQEIFFENSNSPSRQPDTINKFEKVWEINWGDGRDWKVALKFIEEDITIYLSGYYSSHGDSEFSKVAFGVPYEFKEMRYREATLDEVRDIQIEKILN